MKIAKLTAQFLMFLLVLVSCKEKFPSPESVHVLDEVPAYKLDSYQKLSYPLGCWDIQNFGYGEGFYIGDHLAAKVTFPDGSEYFFFEEDLKGSCGIEFIK